MVESIFIQLKDHLLGTYSVFSSEDSDMNKLNSVKETDTETIIIIKFAKYSSRKM